ncbi:hypothetical protein TNCV_2596001 [Trichonephila clavipes]|nr:hypothetical protein TNCV_2596001 [Trichonephila clavipes]
MFCKASAISLLSMLTCEGIHCNTSRKKVERRRFNSSEIDTPVLSPSLCQLERGWMTMPLFGKIQMLPELGNENALSKPV